MMETEGNETLSHVACNRCKQMKEREHFYANTYHGAPRQPCKECLKAARRRDYAERKGYDQSYAQVLRDRYGITLDEYNEKVRAQGNRCAVCRRPESAKSKGGKPRRLAVDHDHATGTVRGLLCMRCNLIVWALEDNHTTLPAIQGYLTTHQKAMGAHISDPAIRGLDPSTLYT